MKKLLGLLAVVLLSATPALAIPALVFDTTPGGAGGSLVYGGAGGPLVGTDIVFVDIASIDTPLNPGATLACSNCSLDFTTGNNTQEGPTQWVWAGGGDFTLTGGVPALGIADGTTLLSGTFTTTPNTPGLASFGTSALFIALGTDTKNAVLAGFFGLGPNDWNFANTEIALGTFTLGVGGAFSAVPNQADIINTQAVPQAATSLLLGLGMLFLGLPSALRRFAA
jgi:hypothetical protein